jgi:hypothetical protein
MLIRLDSFPGMCLSLTLLTVPCDPHEWVLLLVSFVRLTMTGFWVQFLSQLERNCPVVVLCAGARYH